MFNIPPATLAFWSRVELHPATDAQIAQIADLAPERLPEDYVQFLKTYGFARWMLTVPDRFRYTRETAGQTEIKVGSIAHLENPESLKRAMDYAWSDQPELGLPCWPEGVMPIAGNAGSGQVLFDFSEGTATIRYWQPTEDPWGQGDNTKLWEVAPDFTTFVNGLRMKGDV